MLSSWQTLLGGTGYTRHDFKMHLTVRDAAKLLCTSEKQIYQWVEEGELGCHWVSEQPHFDSTELLEWATTRRMRISVELFQNAEGENRRLPSLVESLKIGGIHYRVAGNDRESVLRSVVALMPVPEDMDRETLIEVLLAREAAGSTGMGKGIAIPHVRHPIAINGASASISLCFLQNSVDFCAIDDIPVHTLFLMISPTIRIHLQLLAKLSSALHDQKFKSVVLDRAPAEKILAEADRVEAAFPAPSANAN